MILCRKKVIKQHVVYLGCRSVDDGVSYSQFVYVFRVTSSNNSSHRNPPAHHGLQHVQISLIQPCKMLSQYYKSRHDVLELIISVKGVTCLGQSDEASQVRLRDEGRHLRHTGRGLGEKSPVAKGGGLQL